MGGGDSVKIGISLFVRNVATNRATIQSTAPTAVQRWMVMGMNKLCELFEAEKPCIPDSEADYYVGYWNGLTMAQAIVLTKDVAEVVRCEKCQWFNKKGYEEDNRQQAIPELDFGWCPILHRTMQACGFCSYGERREGE